VRNTIAFGFQGLALFDHLTGRENVGYRLWEQDVLSEKTIESRIAESLHFVGLDDIAEAMPGELSGGMKKRVAIARALASHPRLILYDEPTAGLDPINTHIIKELICRLHGQEHVTQIVVTHDVETAYQVALPIPSVPVLLAAGALAGAGQMNLGMAVGLSVAACFVGDFIWYYLGRYRGRHVLNLLCRISFEPDSCVRRTENFFGRHGM